MPVFHMEPALVEKYRVYYLVSFWLEGLLYGLYFFLFMAAISILRSNMNRNKSTTRAGKFFLGSIIVMFILITIHNFTNIYRLVHAFSEIPLSDRSPSAPVMYIRNWRNWDCYAFGVILALLTWIGDIIVIYRCFLVWNQSYRVILLPCFLLLVSFTTTAVNLYWFRHPYIIPWTIMKYILNVTFPLNFAQNFLTTGLIAARIWLQHRQTRRAGAQSISNGGSVSLYMVLRIIVESAVIYTVEMLLITILWYMDHPAQVIVQHAAIPSTGIVFVLIAIRSHLARAASDAPMESWMRSDVPSSVLRFQEETQEADERDSRRASTTSRDRTHPSANNPPVNEVECHDVDPMPEGARIRLTRRSEGDDTN